jgi:hypothetical protein
MKNVRFCLLTLITFLLVSSTDDLRAQSSSTTYRYAHCDCAYQLTDQIRIRSEAIGIRFHEQSDQQALHSFRSLKYSVWLGVVGQLYLEGTHNPGNGTFRLEHWYAIVPFTEYLQDMTSYPHEVQKLKRNGLRRSDFKRTDDFDPDARKFNPSIHQRKRARAKTLSFRRL